MRGRRSYLSGLLNFDHRFPCLDQGKVVTDEDFLRVLWVVIRDQRAFRETHGPVDD